MRDGLNSRESWHVRTWESDKLGRTCTYVLLALSLNDLVSLLPGRVPLALSECVLNELAHLAFVAICKYCFWSFGAMCLFQTGLRIYYLLKSVLLLPTLRLLAATVALLATADGESTLDHNVKSISFQ